MKLTSNAFNDGETIPAKYTADGENISLPLEIHNAPEETKSYALIFDDPDAPSGTWVHWLAWNIPAKTSNLEEGQTPPGKRGKNDFGKLKYGGPAPPSGTHRYFFKLYALDSELNLSEGATKEELLDAMDGHVIDKAELMGRYSREK